MLYWFDTKTRELDQLSPVEAATAGVKEEEIEKALARRPGALFQSSKDGPPIMVVRTSVRGPRMPDIIALDAQGRLVLVECKRNSATRDTLAQLLDYAAEYHQDCLRCLHRDWQAGLGGATGPSLIEKFREFADDPTVAEDTLGREQVLLVVAASQDGVFSRISEYLSAKGLHVHFVPAQIFRRENGDLFLEVEPVSLDAIGNESDPRSRERVWMINTDERHSTGAWRLFIEKGVAGIWGFPEQAAPLQQGAEAGDVIYAYLNGTGIVASGSVIDGKVFRPTPEQSIFHPDDGNEWLMRVKWETLSDPIPNAEVRTKRGAGLPVRNTFCRLWNPRVREYLMERARVTSRAPA